MRVKNIISVSGGKDSTALLLLALERKTPDMIVVFADTGHEHELTYEYIQYLNDKVHPIRIVKADFEEDLRRRREKTIPEKWKNDGIDEETRQRAINASEYTGNPFLDLVLWKGRFPSTRARFCSQMLKHEPIFEQIVDPLLTDGYEVISWQGVRADESLARRDLPPIEDVGGGLWNYRPILDWTADECFAFHNKYSIAYNPLYAQGCGRVGCMPCIHCRKDELMNIADRFPEVIDRIREWESKASKASKVSKRGKATFFCNTDGHGDGIDEVVQWSRTSRGRLQQDMFRQGDEVAMCSSIYGLCE